MNFKTAKKAAKWRRAWLKCFTASTRNNNEIRLKRRTSKAKRKRAERNYDYWNHKNQILVWDWGHPVTVWYSKKEKRRLWEYND